MLMCLGLVASFTVGRAQAHTEAAPLVTDLIAGHTVKVGEVHTWNDADYLYIKYVTTEDWCLTDTKLQVALSLDSVPQTKSGNPIPGHFAYKASHTCVPETTYRLALTWDAGTAPCIAAKAEVRKSPDSRFSAGYDFQDGAWAAGTRFPGMNWATYFTYTVQAALVIGWANLQWPPSLTCHVGVVSDNVYGQVWIDGVTMMPGPTAGLSAQLGFGPEATNPDGNPGWTWSEASFNVDVGNNDEFVGTMTATAAGTYDYLYRYSTDAGLTWLYADLNGPVPAATLPANPGKMIVLGSAADSFVRIHVTVPAQTPPDSSVYIAGSLGGLYGGLPNWVPDGVVLTREGATQWGITLFGPAGAIVAYKYTLGDWERVEKGAVCEDIANRSLVLAGQDLNDVVINWGAVPPCGGPGPMVDVTFNLTVPAATPADSTVYIAGSFGSFEGSPPEWNPSGIALTKVNPVQWTVTLRGPHGTSAEYKYALGSWSYVEKGAVCEELSNRSITVNWGTDGTQTVNDTVLNWRNVAPCGD